MNAATRPLVSLVNMALFLLSSGARVPLLMMAVSLASWWWLSDYYFALWPQWMDRVAFAACSLVVFAGIAAGSLWFIRRIARNLEPRYRLFGSHPRQAALPVSAWCAHLDTIAAFRGGVWARYWTWRRRRAESLHRRNALVSAESLATIWWLRPRTLACWLMVALWPGLWAVLVLVPLRTNTMEHFAAWTSNSPAAILEVRCVGRDPGTHAPISETLQREPSGFYRHGRCLFLSNAEFEVLSTTFPRVYRRLVVRCLDRCAIAPDKTAATVPEHSVAVIGGRASFEWLQSTPDPLKGLGMAVSLVRQDGGTLDSILIEP